MQCSHHIAFLNLLTLYTYTYTHSHGALPWRGGHSALRVFRRFVDFIGNAFWIIFFFFSRMLRVAYIWAIEWRLKRHVHIQSDEITRIIFATCESTLRTQRTTARVLYRIKHVPSDSIYFCVSSAAGSLQCQSECECWETNIPFGVRARAHTHTLEPQRNNNNNKLFAYEIIKCSRNTKSYYEQQACSRKYARRLQREKKKKTKY